MTFNHRQRITALAHVVALVGIIFLCYVSFMGLVYLWGGNMMLAGVMAVAEAALLYVLCILVQRFKATGRRFGKMIVGERIAVVFTILACMLTLLPFTHFFHVFAREGEVKKNFGLALEQVGPMFDAYETAAKGRIADYTTFLDNAMKSKKNIKKAGLNKYSEGKPDDGNTIARNNMVETLNLQLLPPTHQALRSDAEAWVDKVAGGATTLNVFLIGNIREIQKAVEMWSETMEGRWNTRLDNEPASKRDLEEVKACGEKATQLMGQVQAMLSEKGLPPLYALPLCIFCWLLVFLPYWLQERHSKSWEEFWPEWMRKGKNLPPERDVNQVTYVNIDWDKPVEPLQPSRVADIEVFKKEMERANDPMAFLVKRMEEGLSRKQLLDMMARDHNLMHAAMVKECIEKGVFTVEELVNQCGIDPRFISMMGTTPEDVLPKAGVIRQLPEATTEIFLWGIPSSGKTCALGVILAAARENVVAKGMEVVRQCQGYEYMEILKKVFPMDDAFVMLPGRTPVATNYAMRLAFDDWDNKSHPITLIDMAGELFCAILWQQSGREQLVTEHHRKALEEFEKILVKEKTEHQKFHFFIIEYGAENKKYKGFDQDSYLENGLAFLEDNHVLRDATQGVYVIVTKTDKARLHMGKDGDLEKYLGQYLRTYYPNFLRVLDKYCKKYELCGGHAPDPIPFDIGEVCFENYCHLSTQRARDVVKVMLARSKGFPKGWKGKLARWMGD